MLGKRVIRFQFWAKPQELSTIMDYKFAVDGTKELEEEYIQAKLSPGRVDVSDYNSMRVIDPSDEDQSTVFPHGLTERLFDGSFNDSKINDIDGRGWRFGQDVPNNQITASQDANSFRYLLLFLSKHWTLQMMILFCGSRG